MTRGQTADSQMKPTPIAEGGIDNGAGLAMIDAHAPRRRNEVSD